MTRSRLPRRLPAGIGLLAGVAAILLVVDAPGAGLPVALEALALAVVVFGIGHSRRGHPALGLGVAAVGGLGVVVSAGLVFSRVSGLSALLELLPGMIGLLALALGVAPARRGWERGFLVAGGTGLFVGVLASGVLHGAGTLSLLAATVATVLAWDAGEHAVTLGEHVGTDARAFTAELVHPAATLLVGVAGVAVTFAIAGLSITGLPLVALLALLAASGLSLFALYH